MNAWINILSDGWAAFSKCTSEGYTSSHIYSGNPTGSLLLCQIVRDPSWSDRSARPRRLYASTKRIWISPHHTTRIKSDNLVSTPSVLLWIYWFLHWRYFLGRQKISTSCSGSVDSIPNSCLISFSKSFFMGRLCRISDLQERFS